MTAFDPNATPAVDAAGVPDAPGAPSAHAPMLLRLFVTGSTRKSARAITNLKRICDEHATGGYQLEIVDLYQQPGAAARNQILAAPTLIKKLPPPVRRLIGDMSDEQRVLCGLDLGPRADGASADVNVAPAPGDAPE